MAKILGPDGRPIDPGSLREPQSATVATSAHDRISTPSRGITPARMHQLLDGAMRGDLATQAALGEDILDKNAHVLAEMGKRQRAVLTLDYSIVPPPNASAAEQKIAAAAAEWFNAIPDIEDLMLNMLDAIGHAYSCLEVTWETLGKTWQPRIEHRPPTWFQTLPDAPNTLRLRDNTIHGQLLRPYGWIVHIHRARPGILARVGLLRALAWPFLFKNYSLRDWSELLEVYGLPIRVGKYGAGATQEEQARLLRAVRDIAKHASGIMPDTMSIEFMQAMANGRHEPFEAMINYAERSESKLILGGTLTSQADGKTSTNALGNVHNEVRHDLKVSDVRQLASTMTYQLVHPYCRFNIPIPAGCRLPLLQFDTREAANIAAYADALPKLVGVGMRIPVSWAHEKMAIPQSKKGDAVLSQQNSSPAPAPSDTPPAATRRYIALKQSAAGELVPEDQALIDGMLELLPLDLVEDAGREMLASAVRAVREGEDEEDIQMRLLQAVPEMENSKMVVLLEKLIFIAGLVGHAYA